MKYDIYASAMWHLFSHSFRQALAKHWNGEKADMVMKKAKPIYKKLVKETPSIGGMKANPMTMNLLSAMQFAAIYFAADKKIPVDAMKKIYHDGMVNGFFFKKAMNGKNMFLPKVQKKKMKLAEKSQHSTYKYDWVWTFVKGKKLDTCETDFTRCGIYNLFCDLGIKEIPPAMCVFDYAMAEYMGVDFHRETTIAGGGAVCDCHYAKKNL